MILTKIPESRKDVTNELKHLVNKIDMHKNTSAVNSTKVVPSVLYTLKNIYLINNLFPEVEPKIIKNKEVSFSYYLRQCIKNTVENIHFPTLMNNWKSNMEKASYKINLQRRVALPSYISVLDSHKDEKNCCKNCE